MLQEYDRRFPLFSREEVLGAGVGTGGRRSAVDEYEVGELLRWDARRPAFDTLSLQPGTAATASFEDSLSVRSLDAHLQVNIIIGLADEI